MPRKASPEARGIAAALQWEHGRWAALAAIVLLLAFVLALGDNVAALLRYDRSAISAGGWWRLLTAHIVHLDAHHLVLNALGLTLMWALFAGEYAIDEWCAIVMAGALAISSGLWWLSPRVTWYVGASGVLHAVMTAGTVSHFVRREWDRWILAVCIVGKLVWEQWAGQDQPLVVVDAHLYGAAAGVVVGGALRVLPAILRRSNA